MNVQESIERLSKRSKSSLRNRQANDALMIAGQQGLLSGGRKRTVSGRVSSRLVEQAKKKTGIKSDSKLIEVALAIIVTTDDYADWLLAHRGTINRDLDLDF